MIRVRVTRVEDDGRETDLGELRMTELGAAPAVYCDTADGRSVMRDVRAALACLAPESVSAVHKISAQIDTLRSGDRFLRLLRGGRAACACGPFQGCKVCGRYRGREPLQ